VAPAPPGLNHVGLTANSARVTATTISHELVPAFHGHVQVFYLPIMVYYDNGYGPYISDYSTWSQGWGIGLRYW